MDIRQNTIKEYIRLMKEERGKTITEEEARWQIFMFAHLYHLVSQHPRSDDTKQSTEP